MKERPILFSAPMVLAILDGKKIQTRRAMNPQPITQEDGFVWTPKFGAGCVTNFKISAPDFAGCKFGKKGDRLWVRETWGLTGWAANSRLSDFSNPDFVLKDNLIHRAGCDGYDESTQHWRPSIHMPRWASRIDLEIIGVRVERLQDISEEDAKSEGMYSIPFYPDDGFPLCDGWTWLKDDGKSPLYNKPSSAYTALWESINGQGSWYKNPWVWVIEFKRCERE